MQREKHDKCDFTRNTILVVFMVRRFYILFIFINLGDRISYCMVEYLIECFKL